MKRENRLINFKWSVSGHCFFCNFGVGHVASQRFVLTKNNMFVFFWIILSFFLIFGSKKDAQRNLATNGPSESP